MGGLGEARAPFLRLLVLAVVCVDRLSLFEQRLRPFGDLGLAHGYQRVIVLAPGIDGRDLHIEVELVGLLCCNCRLRCYLRLDFADQSRGRGRIHDDAP